MCWRWDVTAADWVLEGRTVQRAGRKASPHSPQSSGECITIKASSCALQLLSPCMGYGYKFWDPMQNPKQLVVVAFFKGKMVVMLSLGTMDPPIPEHTHWQHLLPEFVCIILYTHTWVCSFSSTFHSSLNFAISSALAWCPLKTVGLYAMLWLILAISGTKELRYESMKYVTRIILSTSKNLCVKVIWLPITALNLKSCEAVISTVQLATGWNIQTCEQHSNNSSDQL